MGKAAFHGGRRFREKLKKDDWGLEKKIKSKLTEIAVLECDNDVLQRTPNPYTL